MAGVFNYFFMRGWHSSQILSENEPQVFIKLFLRKLLKNNYGMKEMKSSSYHKYFFLTTNKKSDCHVVIGVVFFFSKTCRQLKHS